uniref:Exocyst subunit Exo70 family protein n=1 Tax=Oryza rufipogon TaxID=4529 RepID=A0A0E0PLJ9_ORYRU
METQLPTVMELDSSEPANFTQPSRRYSYLEKIRSLSVVSGEVAGWSSSASASSSRSVRSSYYSSSMSSNASGGPHNHRYAPYSNSSPGDIDIHGAQDIARQMVHDGFMVNLIREFDRAPGPALERWFSELDVGWLLRSAAAADKEQSELGLADLVRRWTRGYTVMAEALSATQTKVAGVPAIILPQAQRDHNNIMCDQELEDDLRLQVARFVEATVSKMLAFVDALAAENTRLSIDNLSRLVGLCNCIYSCIYKCKVVEITDSEEIVDSEEITDSELQCLARKVDGAFRITTETLCTAIWRMAKVAEAVTPVLSGWDSCENFKQNAEIHEATRLIVDYVRLFWGYESLWINMQYLKWVQIPITTIRQMLINFEDQLEKNSESFSDPSLRYLFLLNNSYFVREEFLEPSNYVYILPSGTTLKFMQYQEKYMLASWEPVLYCLHEKMPLWFPKHSSQLARFKSEFQKTFRHQKLWKVPNPRLRQKLREAIIDKVITGYKRYLEKCSSDLQDMEDMVNELFEG